MSSRTWIFALGLISAFAFGFALAELSGGIIEVPRHWWSTFPVLGLITAGALAFLTRPRDI